MKISVIERVKLIDVVQSIGEGNRIIFKMVDDLHRDLSFSDEELTALGITVGEGMTSFPQKSFAHTKEITIPETLKGVLLRALLALERMNPPKLSRVLVPFLETLEKEENERKADKGKTS